MLRKERDEAPITHPIVLDNGSGVIKAGFAGSDAPKVVFPAIVGRPKHLRVMSGALEGDIFVGNKAEEYRGLLTLKYPIEHGVIVDWENMELLWNHAYLELKSNSEEHPLLLTEPPLNPHQTRQKTAEVFFETFGCPSLFIAIQAVLALYATGRTTGVLLDSGDGVTHIVPIFEGFALTHSISRSDVGGRSITRFLSLLLRKSGYVFHTSAEMQIVREIKEACCYVLFDPQPKDSLTQQSRMPDSITATPEISYTLPDGVSINIAEERFRAPEILFNPSLIGLEYDGVHDLLIESLSKADLDLRKTLYTQIILSGGSTFFPGFGERLLNEVRKVAAKDNTIRISAPSDRKMLTWGGGSILASLSSFKKIWTSKQEFEEYGPDIVNRKFF